MFVIVKYFNYRKEASFALVGSVPTQEEATDMAREMAIKEAALDDEIVIEEKPENCYIEAEDALVQFCVGDGYQNWVFAVMKLPTLGI